MKRILLACFLFTATCSVTQAQSTTQNVSKSSFTSKVKQMDTYIGQNKMTEAKAAWEEVHKMMLTEFGVVKSHIANAGTDAEKSQLMTQMRS